MSLENVSCPAESDGHEESQGSIDNDCHGTDCDENNQKTSGKDDFPVYLDDPFENATCNSDLVLLVEDRNLYVHKSVLSVNSPVFNIMLNKPGFVEKNEMEIPLPGKKYDAMLDFLKHLYPVYSLKGIPDDLSLQNVLPLADEYQVEHVRLKCDQYIVSRLASISTDMKAVLQYLFLCEKNNLTDNKDKLIHMATMFSLKELKCDATYGGLPPETQISIQQERCLRLEGVLEELSSINKEIGRFKFEPHVQNCYKALTSDQKCYACLGLALEKVEQYQRGKKVTHIKEQPIQQSINGQSFHFGSIGSSSRPKQKMMLQF